MSRAIRLASSALVAAGLAASVSAQAPASPLLAGQVDEIFSNFKPGGPGCAVAVYQNATVVLARGYGAANLEYDVPITPATPFIVGSVSKQFTAAAIALLVEEKRIALTDDVRKYVPELADYGTPITIDIRAAPAAIARSSPDSRSSERRLPCSATSATRRP